MANARSTRDCAVHARASLGTAALQKLGVVIDACMVGSRDSAFLQQAAHLTGGLYLRPPRPAALLQYLLVCQLASCLAAMAFAHKHMHEQALSLPVQGMKYYTSVLPADM